MTGSSLLVEAGMTSVSTKSAVPMAMDVRAVALNKLCVGLERNVPLEKGMTEVLLYF